MLKELLEQVPSLLTMLVCTVFAIVRWKRHPRVSLVVLISLGLLFFEILIFFPVLNWIPEWFISAANSENREATIRNVYLILGLISNGIAAVAFALLLMGIFMQRKPGTQT
jgi:Na+/H+ antiporter NhaC